MANAFLLGRRHGGQVERQHWLAAFDQFKNVGMVVPADVEIGRCFGKKGAHGKKRRAFGVGGLKQTRRFSDPP